MRGRTIYSLRGWGKVEGGGTRISGVYKHKRGGSLAPGLVYKIPGRLRDRLSPSFSSVPNTCPRSYVYLRRRDLLQSHRCATHTGDTRRAHYLVKNGCSYTDNELSVPLLPFLPYLSYDGMTGRALELFFLSLVSFFFFCSVICEFTLEARGDHGRAGASLPASLAPRLFLTSLNRAHRLPRGSYIPAGAIP